MIVVVVVVSNACLVKGSPGSIIGYVELVSIMYGNLSVTVNVA